MSNTSHSDPAAVPEEVGAIVSARDTKQTILDRFAQRERHWEQQISLLQRSYNEQKATNEQQADAINRLTQQFNRISASSPRNNQQTPHTRQSQQAQTLSSPPTLEQQQQPNTAIQTIRNMKPAPLTFSGLLNEDIDLWLKCILNYVNGAELSDRQMVQVATGYLRGSALQWWGDQIADTQFKTTNFGMEEFMGLCKARWLNVHVEESARSKLDQLKQTKSIQEYNDEFEKLIGRLGADFATEQPKIHAWSKAAISDFRCWPEVSFTPRSHGLISEF